ncbi:MAG: hypothetical protein LUD70_22300 [Bacteroides ovatus]|nr:hypothetical protein [Bacteroides ovatus]
MKKSLLSVFTMVAMAAAFTACSNDDIEVPDVKNGEARSVFMKLELPTLTRSTEAPVAPGTVATVSNLHVYFHDGTSILKYVNATTTTPITIANLTTGTQITDVPAAATTVTVCGNIPAGTSLPTGGTVAALKAVQLEITSQSAVADVVLSGDDKPLQTWTAGSPALPYAPGITDGDKYAEVEIGPAVARVEIEGLATTASSAVDGFTLEGIYVNNFFEKFNLAGTVVGTKVQYGATPALYAQGQGLYTSANAGKLFDQSAVAATGTPKEVIPPTVGQRWAYQVVPNSNSTDANEQLQLVFKLSNLVAKPGSVNFGTDDQFITVRGFKDGSGNIVELEKGKIYTISKTDFTFDESNLSTIPNTSAVSVWLKVTVKAWTVVPVKPNL